MPAFPLPVVARHGFDLVVEGYRWAAGWRDIRAVVRGGHAETRRFLFAGEEARIEARPVDNERPLGPWVCELGNEQGWAARFTMELAAHGA